MLLLNAAENDLEWLDAPTQHDSAVMDFSAALSQTLLGMACVSLSTRLSSSLSYQPPSSCNIY